MKTDQTEAIQMTKSPSVQEVAAIPIDQGLSTQTGEATIAQTHVDRMMNLVPSKTKPQKIMNPLTSHRQSKTK